MIQGDTRVIQGETRVGWVGVGVEVGESGWGGNGSKRYSDSKIATRK